MEYTYYRFSSHDSSKGICQRCGFVFNLSALRREWTGLQVCDGPNSNHCFEMRQPQDSVRGVPDRQNVAHPSPEGADVFITSYLMRENNQPYIQERGGPINREV